MINDNYAFEMEI